MDVVSVCPLQVASVVWQSPRGGWVLTPNLDILRVLARDPAYAALCSTTTLRVADGMPLIWASRLQRTGYDFLRIKAVEPGEKREVLAGGQLRVQMELVRQ